ncbi:MAG: FAD-dependent oxidoreductase [Scandinavium sp.]|uniref:FAD-dependent oxidoreductase n=1 Tax=Scandinavium sp. TaxID=2830653 RepID=UPI003F363DB2
MAKGKNKLYWALLLGVAVALAVSFDLHQALSLESLKTNMTQLVLWREQSPVLLFTVFFVIYTLVTALSIPGATVMTLAAAALFGLWKGLLLVSFASSLGALLAFLLARYLLRDAVKRRFGAKLALINAGMEKDGAFYLFTLRMVPLFPFFLINLLMGLTTLSAWRYYWVSQLGMLAGTVVYVNAGTQLAEIKSLADILSPGLLFSFALLGVFPWLAKMGISRWKRRQLYARWKKPVAFDRNLIVIGAGAAGLVSAYIAAAVRAKVTLVEAGKMGGDCLNTGCVPSKALIKSARIAHDFRHAERYGLAAQEPVFSFRQVMDSVAATVRAIAPHDSVERYTALGVEVIQGYAKLVDPWTVEIASPGGETQRLTARSIILATGAKPRVPSLPGLETAGYLTSDTLWSAFSQLDAIPQRIAILGGGPIGCELAQSLARLGAKVTQLEKGPRLMSREDEEASELVRAALEGEGVQVLTGHQALRCENEGEQKILVALRDGVEIRLAYDALICAVGRVARLEGYGLEALGIPTQKTIVTNDYLETLYPNIYAAGDAAGPFQFTHVAAHQAWYATVNALFGNLKKFKVDYRVVPRATFVDPEVASVGLNEQTATAQGIAFEVTHYGIDDLDRAIADSAACGFVKVLTVPGKDRILGVTIVGEHAADLLAEFVLAMKHGLGLTKILGTVHTYPTLSEANKYAAGEWKRAHAPQRVLEWLGRYHRWRRG